MVISASSASYVDVLVYVLHKRGLYDTQTNVAIQLQLPVPGTEWLSEQGWAFVDDSQW